MLLLQVLEQTLEIQGNTQAALADQRQQMHRIEDDLDKVGAAVIPIITHFELLACTATISIPCRICMVHSSHQESSASPK